MDLKINNKLIIEPIENILKLLRDEINGKYLKHISRADSENILITCPNHKGGQERNPSCRVYTRRDDPKVFYGTAHCFACGYSAKLYTLIGDCLDADEEVGKLWLLDRYGDVFVEYVDLLPEIEITQHTQQQFLDESILLEYEYYHDYMWQRKLSKEVVDKFRVGFDPKRGALTFPVWDEFNRLKMITTRSVTSKFFFIDKEIKKPVYLLNHCINANYPFVVITEAQIDALTAWSYGVPACAFIGVGSKEQYEILNKSPIRSWVTMFDNDIAGKQITDRFNQFIRKDVFVTNIQLPSGKKDVNDLSKEEFDTLLINNNLTWRLSSL